MLCNWIDPTKDSDLQKIGTVGLFWSSECVSTQNGVTTCSRRSVRVFARIKNTYT